MEARDNRTEVKLALAFAVARLVSWLLETQCGKPRRVFRPDSGDSRLIRRQLSAPHLTPLRRLPLLQALGQGLKASAALVWVVWVLGVGHEAMMRNSLSLVNFLP